MVLCDEKHGVVRQKAVPRDGEVLPHAQGLGIGRYTPTPGPWVWGNALPCLAFSFFLFCIAETLNINNFHSTIELRRSTNSLKALFRVGIYTIHDYPD